MQWWHQMINLCHHKIGRTIIQHKVLYRLVEPPGLRLVMPNIMICASGHILDIAWSRKSTRVLHTTMSRWNSISTMSMWSSRLVPSVGIQPTMLMSSAALTLVSESTVAAISRERTLNRSSFPVDEGEALLHQQPRSLLLVQGDKAKILEDVV